MVVVTGCYAQIKADELDEMPEVDYVIDNTKKSGIVKYILSAKESGSPHLLTSDIHSKTSFLNLDVKDFKGRNRAFLKIQDGCDSFCSYCIVPYARGYVRSLAADEVLRSINRFAEAGFKEVVLSGIHIGKYGQDLTHGMSLLSLLKEQFLHPQQFLPRSPLWSPQRHFLPATVFLSFLFLKQHQLQSPPRHRPI